MRRRVTVKSNDLRSDLFNGQTSRPYNRIGRHLLLTRCYTLQLELVTDIQPIVLLTRISRQQCTFTFRKLSLADCISDERALEKERIVYVLSL